MNHEVGHDELMRYLDGEVRPAEQRRIEEHLETCTECAREISVFRELKADVETMRFRLNGPGTPSVWNEVNRRVTRPTGWLLVLAGTAVWTMYAVYVFLTSPARPWEKAATAAIVVGILLLLASVIWDRYQEWLSDPYRDVLQ